MTQESRALSGKVIAFEGLDGAGKSTVIEVLTKTLRDSGYSVFLPRMGKDHSSRPARMIRELTRDRVNIQLRPRAEMALYCAREAQILDEQVRPAVARGDVVLLDRSILTAVVLGCWGRGLPRETGESMANAAAGGLWPDVMVILDVHARTSRIRKRIGKARSPKTRDPSRKGMSGSGLKERVREGYRQIAAERGYPLFHTERVNPRQLADRVVEALTQGARPTDLETPEDRVPRWQVDPQLDFEAALEQLPPELAIYMSRNLVLGRARRQAASKDDPSLAAWAADIEDPLREQLAEQAPGHVISGWIRRPLEGPGDLRERLAGVAPQPVARSLRHLDDARADQLREQLAEQAPGEVVESLAGREDDWAQQLRERLWPHATVAQAAASLVHCSGEVAWRLREELFERDPVIALRSLRGQDDDRSRQRIAEYAALAPKIALRVLTGNGSDFAHDLRRQLHSTGREVIDSLGWLDDDASMAMREADVEQWPSSVLGSLSRVTESPRVDTLIEQCKRHGAGDVHLLRQLALRSESARRPAWARREDGASLEE